MNTEMTCHLMFTCNGTLLTEQPSNTGCSKAAERDVLRKTGNTTVKFRRLKLSEYQILLNVRTQIQYNIAIYHGENVKCMFTICSILHTPYLQRLCMLEFDPLPITHTQFYYLFTACVCVCAHNDNPILTEMLSKVCPHLAGPQICSIASGIKIYKNAHF
jgi:hypothetical protein